MNEEIEVTMHRHALEPKSSFVTTIWDTVLHSLPEAILRKIVEKVAERYVEEHYAELAAKLNQEAIANLAVAESGKKIAEEIRTRPVVLHDEEVRTEVFQRGIFGGLRRL